MRRLRTIVALVLLSLALTPVPADAYFWAWLDDWSGPRFMGTEVEWRVWCQSERPGQNRALLLSLRRRVRVELAYYAAAASKDPDRQRHLDLAASYARISDSFLEAVLYPGENADADKVDLRAGKALQWRTLAADHYKWATSRKFIVGDTMHAPEEPTLPPMSKAMTTGLLPAADLPTVQLKSFAVSAPFSIAVSACDYKPLQRDRQFVSLKFGWAFDAKDRNEVYDHRMVTIGASYNVVATPFLTVGSGVGIAVLTSKVRDPFYKFYVQPTIVDFRPGALGRDGGSRGPWWHVFYLRYSTMVVPTGFAADSFGGQTQRYSAELTNNVGLHADLTPVIRKLQGRW
ncbi:MAG: hypothetical protein ABIT71_13335 [Vicinamibacteraceae bacterium]